MKGIALSIETIIVLILAVAVMGVLLFYFGSTTTPIITTTQLITEKESKCSQYIQLDSSCSGKYAGGSQKSIETNTNNAKTLKTEIVNKCRELEKRGQGPVVCKTNDEIKCLQQCCTICPKG